MSPCVGSGVQSWGAAGQCVSTWCGQQRRPVASGTEKKIGNIPRLVKNLQRGHLWSPEYLQRDTAGLGEGRGRTGLGPAFGALWDQSFWQEGQEASFIEQEEERPSSAQQRLLCRL